jgi:hypothetical protein
MIPINQPPQADILRLLCAANAKIDEIAQVRAGLAPAPSSPLSKIAPNSIEHHVIAIAGFLRRTSARRISFQIGKIIVEARRAE